jgi:hypothetical protein
MKTALPENAKIAKEAKECMQECVSEFISFITSEGKLVRLLSLRDLSCLFLFWSLVSGSNKPDSLRKMPTREAQDGQR